MHTKADLLLQIGFSYVADKILYIIFYENGVA